MAARAAASRHLIYKDLDGRVDAPQHGCYDCSAGWSSLVARWAHNPKVGGSNPPPATNSTNNLAGFWVTSPAHFPLTLPKAAQQPARF